jgi:hypothetical protein
MDLIAKLLIVAFFVWALWLFLRPRSLFVVSIAQGAPKATRGVVTRAFLEVIRDVCARFDVQNGVIRGEQRAERVALAFSRTIPPSAQQQLRNWWALSGWSAQPRRVRR